jgi:hypothetical protein
MSNWNIQETYRADKAVVGSIHFNATKSVSLENTNIGLNSEGKKVTKAGLFLAKVGGVNRFLPRDVVQSAVTASANLPVTMPEIFLPGDEIYHLEPQGLVTLSSVWAAGDKLTLRFIEPSQGINISYTHTQVGADLAALLPELVTALNDPTNPLHSYARFEAGGAGELKIFTRGKVFTVEASAVTAGAGAVAITNEISATPVYLGVVSHTDYANSTVVLTGNSAANLGEGARVGTLVEDIYGLYNHGIDFTNKPTETLKAIERCDRVYKSGLAYYDDELASRFPNLIFEG